MSSELEETDGVLLEDPVERPRVAIAHDLVQTHGVASNCKASTVQWHLVTHNHGQ